MKRQAYIFARTIILSTVLTMTVTGTQNQQALKPFVGKWRAMVSFTESGGRFTASLAEQLDVRQPDQNTVEFSLKPVTSDNPVFQTRLTYDVASKGYLLSVKTSDNPSVIEKLKLTYNESTGFSGEGTLTDVAGKTHAVRVQIKREKDGYDWSVRDPSAPAGNDIVFAFTFLKRVE